MSYKILTQYYDEIHAELTQDIPFLLENIKGKKVLEIGCGSGRLLLPLAQAGFHVTGIDNSAEMLALAKEKVANAPSAVRNNITLLEADARRLSLFAQFDTVIVPYNTLLHFDRDGVEQLVKMIRRCLGENGRLLIDTLNPAVLDDLPPNKATATSDLERTFNDGTQQFSKVWLNPSTQTFTIEWSFVNETETVVEETYAYLQIDELEKILVNFPKVEIFGDYNKMPFDAFSARCIVRADLNLSKSQQVI